MTHCYFPKLFTFVMQRVFHLCLLSSMSLNWHFLKNGMTPAKPCQREHLVPRKGGHSTDTLLWIQQAVTWKPEKHEKRRLSPGSMNRGHFSEMGLWKKSINTKKTLGVVHPLDYSWRALLRLLIASKGLQITICKGDQSFDSFPAVVLPGLQGRSAALFAGRPCNQTMTPDPRAASGRLLQQPAFLQGHYTSLCFSLLYLWSLCPDLCHEH